MNFDPSKLRSYIFVVKLYHICATVATTGVNGIFQKGWTWYRWSIQKQLTATAVCPAWGDSYWETFGDGVLWVSGGGKFFSLSPLIIITNSWTYR